MGAGLLLASLLLNACGAAEPAVPAAPSTSETLQRIVDDGWSGVMKGRADFRGSLILHIESAAGNYTVRSGDPVSDPEQIHIRVASNSKNFTAAAVMLLAQEGKLKIDDRLSDLIPGTANPYLPATADFQIPFRDTITLRQLLGHRGGVFDLSNSPVPAGVAQPYAGQRYLDYTLGLPNNGEHTFTFAELAGVVAANHLSQFAPGTKYQYSNGGYSLLAQIIERVSGMRYDQFLQQRFLTPQGLSQTRSPYLGSDQSIESPFLPGYAYLPPPDGLIDVTRENVSAHVGEGNMISNVHELALWYRALFTGTLGLEPGTVAQMMEVQPTFEALRFYGLGVTYTPGLGYGHDGTQIGSVSTCRYDPTTGTLVIIHASSLDVANIGDEVFRLYDIAAAAKGALEGRTINTSDFRSGLPPDSP